MVFCIKVKKVFVVKLELYRNRVAFLEQQGLKFSARKCLTA